MVQCSSSQTTMRKGELDWREKLYARVCMREIKRTYVASSIKFILLN